MMVDPTTHTLLIVPLVLVCVLVLGCEKILAKRSCCNCFVNPLIAQASPASSHHILSLY